MRSVLLMLVVAAEEKNNRGSLFRKAIVPKRLIYLVCLGLLLGLVGSVQVADAAVKVGEDANAVGDGGFTEVMSFNWVAGTDSCLVVMVAGEWDPVSTYVDSITFGSQLLTQAVASPTGTGGGNYAEIWYLLSLSAVNDNITVTFNASDDGWVIGGWRGAVVLGGSISTGLEARHFITH